MRVLELPLLSAGAAAAGAGRGGKSSPAWQFIKIRELFTILEQTNGKKDCYDSCKTYSCFSSPLRKLETFPLMFFSPLCVEHTGCCTPTPWHPTTPSWGSRCCFRGAGPWPTLLLHRPESAGTFHLLPGPRSTRAANSLLNSQWRKKPSLLFIYHVIRNNLSSLGRETSMCSCNRVNS